MQRFPAMNMRSLCGEPSQSSGHPGIGTCGPPAAKNSRCFGYRLLRKGPESGKYSLIFVFRRLSISWGTAKSRAFSFA